MLTYNQYFIREHVGLLKLTDVYDILDPQTQGMIGQAREEISGWIKVLRLIINKQLMPTRVNVYEGSDERPSNLVFSIRRGVALFRPQVDITDANGTKLGYLKKKVLSLGGAFDVFSVDGQQIASVKGDWKGWNFRFLHGENELGVITKKWAGLGRELFTSADNYLISIHGPPDPAVNVLLLAAGLAIDTVLKENNG